MTRTERMAALLLEARAGGALVDTAREPGPADAREAYRVQDIVMKELPEGMRAGAWKAIPPRPGTAPAASPVPLACVMRSPARLPTPRMCETRLSGWETAPALWKLADFQSNAALIIGNGTEKWRTVDFGALQVELVVNGARAAGAVGGHPAGNPSSLLPSLREHCAGRGGVQPGDVVTTGSWVGIVKVRPGDEIEARFAGIGECRLTLERR
ncbi:MAG: fumarylacetoacetate hydrolase family protein [Betaproteobacteria bacterium]